MSSPEELSHDLYWLGVYVSFFMTVNHAITLTYYLNAPIERNLRLINCRVSWMTLSAKPIDEYDINKVKGFPKAALWVVWMTLFSFLSWLNLIFWTFTFLKAIIEKFTAPKEVRDARWRLWHLELSTEEICAQLLRGKGVAEKDLKEKTAELMEEVEKTRTFLETIGGG